MTLETTLNNAQGGALVDNLATSFGVDPNRVKPALAVMTEALTRRIDRNTLSRGGVADIVDLIIRSGAGQVLANPQTLSAPQTEAMGNHILDVLIGSKDTSRGIAHRAAAASGLDEAVLRKMLPTVASMVIGSLQKDAPAVFADRLKGVQGLRSAGGSPLPLPGDNIPPIDSDRETPRRYPQPGSSGGGVGGTIGGSPLPIPGDEIPGTGGNSPGGGGGYDNLPDIIRRGGARVPGGGDLSDVIRSILGSLLGFQPRGLFGWVLALIFSRWFRGIIGGIFRRLFLGR